MRRLPSIATFVFLVALSPAFAQMRGGGHGFSGGHGGSGVHMGGGHGFSGTPPGRGFAAPRMQSRGFRHSSPIRQPFLHGERFRGDTFRGDRFGRDRFRHDRFRHDHDRFRDFAFRNCWGWNCGWGWPWWGAGYYDPYWWDSGSSYDEDRERDIATAREMNAQSLEEQRIRRQEDQDIYARPDSPPQARETAEAPTPATVLVFRDQRKQEVQNYAIVGRTLWNFTAQRTQKIPLTDLDLAATAKVNDERGVDFRVPATAEGQ